MVTLHAKRLVDGLRQEPRFRDLVKRVGLEQ
jgi:hypothetical protein